MMKRLANLLCVFELALFVLVPIIAWVANVLGAGNVNLVSEEALRWFFRHSAEMLSSPHLSLLILMLTAIGSLQESGLAHHIACVAKSCNEKPKHTNALIGSLSFLFVLLALLFLPVIFHSTALLSVTGTLFPSPWLYGFPLALSVGIVLASLIYATSSSRLNGVDGIANLLCQGFIRYGVWIADVMMGGLLYHIIKYCLQ